MTTAMRRQQQPSAATMFGASGDTPEWMHALHWPRSSSDTPSDDNPSALLDRRLIQRLAEPALRWETDHPERATRLHHIPAAVRGGTMPTAPFRMPD